MLNIANTAKISKHSDIEDSVRGTKIEIGEYAVIDSFVKIKPTGGLGDVYVGQNSVINSGCVLYSGNGIYIGDNVLVAANCTFAATNHAYRSRALLIRQQGFLPSKGGVIVHNDSWIGAGCILLDGAIVNQGCVIGAGSVVRNELPEYSICVGNPAMPVSYRK